MDPTISVVVITLNEEKKVEDCLRSVRWADEIIVVDSFSTDATLAIVAKYTPHIIQREWPGMVGTQRNVGLDAATSDWILFLDADERVTDGLRDEIQGFVRREGLGQWAGGKIPRKNYFFGKWLRCTYPNFTKRFLRNGVGRYNEKPGLGFDSLLFSEENVYKFKQPLIHFTVDTLSRELRKIDFDSTLQSSEKFRAGRRVWWGDIVFRPLAAFFRVFLLKKGFLDGARGFVHACLTSFNTFMKYAKLLEKGRWEAGER